MTEQFERGKPVWYLNKRTKKVYACIYSGASWYSDHFLFTSYGCIHAKDDCLFATKELAIVSLNYHILDCIDRIDAIAEKLYNARNRISQLSHEPTEQENKAYKRLYARYLDWTGDRSR